MIFTSEVKWIKITTDMFEDDKIDYIQTLPEADAIIVIWVRLLTLAGKCNAGGYIYLTENIPYDPNMLASKFRKPINTVNMALEIFNKLRMIECDDNGFFLTNWEKHQNIDGLEKIKEQNRVRVQNYRQKQKLLKNGNVTGNVTDNVTGNDDVTQGNAIDIDKEIDIEIDIKNNIPYKEVIEYLNEKAGTKYRYTTKATQEKIKARWKENFTLDDFKTVIDKKCNEWLKTDMEKFLRPETLFGTKFEGYLNQKGSVNNEPGSNYKPNTETGEGKWAGFKIKPIDTTGIDMSDPDIM